MEAKRTNNLIRLSEILRKLDPYQGPIDNAGSLTEMVLAEVSCGRDSTIGQGGDHVITPGSTNVRCRVVADLASGETGFVDASAVWVDKRDDTVYVEAEASLTHEPNLYSVAVTKNLHGIRVVACHQPVTSEGSSTTAVARLLPVTEVTEELIQKPCNNTGGPRFWSIFVEVSCCVCSSYLLCAMSLRLAMWIFPGQALPLPTLTIKAAAVFNVSLAAFEYYRQKRSYARNGIE
jgi:hypothetical protein